MRPIYAIRVGEELSGKTVRAILTQVAGVSQSILRRAKRLGGIRVNGEEVKVSATVKTGDLLELLDHVCPDPAILPEPISLRIVYEDARLVVVDKPAGMLVHPARKYRTGTVANALAWLYLTRSEQAGIHPVHRLDRGTSGLVLIAKDPLTHFKLAAQIASNRLKRRYLALVEGVMLADSGVFDVPLELAPGSLVVRRPAADEQTGVPARTRFEVVERLPNRTLLKVTLDTGRTHQIRVHLASAGYPLVGDSLYGSASDDIGRQALHACELSFDHPGHADGWANPCLGKHCECAIQQRVTLHSDLPGDFRTAIAASRV